MVKCIELFDFLLKNFRKIGLKGNEKYEICVLLLSLCVGFFLGLFYFYIEVNVFFLM